MPTEQFWLMLAQTIATAFLGIGAISVAVVSAAIAYRNNFGWTPGIVIKAIAFWVPDRHTVLKLNFEVWNRFKYGISLQAVTIRFENLRINQDESPLVANKETSFAPNNMIIFNIDERLEAVTKSDISLDIVCYPQKANSLTARAIIQAQYYNPRTNKTEYVTLSRVLVAGVGPYAPVPEDPVKGMIG